MKNRNWGSNKTLKDLPGILGHSGAALQFVRDWADICKRLNPTPDNVERQNECLERFKIILEYKRV